MMPEIPMKPSRLCDRVRQLLGLLITDRTVRRWRAEAFVERKKFYNDADAQQIAEYAVLLMQVGDVSEARKLFAQTLDQRSNKSDEISQPIDVRAESVA